MSKQFNSLSLPEAWRGPAVKPSLVDLKQFRDHPHRFLLELAREHGDIFWYGAGPIRFVFGARPEHVHHVLVEGQQHYSKRTFQYGFLKEVTGDGLLTSDGTLWRERRRIQQPAFRKKRLDLVSDSTRRATARMLDAWANRDQPELDVASEMFELSLDVVMDVLFGYTIGDEAADVVGATLGVLHHLIRRSRSIPGIPSWLTPRRHAEYAQSLAVLDGVIARILQRGRASGGRAGDEPETLLDLLVEAEGEQRITPEGVRNEMMTMIIAGHETVASALTWAWHLLGTAPDDVAALRNEADAANDSAAGLEILSSLTYARNVISEALRLYPPAWIVTRRSEGAATNTPSWLPRGTLVMLSPFVTQRLEAYWPDPDVFNPRRFEAPVANGTWFPFGAGQRLCIGKDFALVEAAIILSDVSRRFTLRPTSDPVREYSGVTLQPEGGLPMTIAPR